MQLKVILLTTATIFFGSHVAAISITLFAGANCQGANGGTDNTIQSHQCLTLQSCSTKSVAYSGVPSQIQFFISGGGHDACTNGASLVLGGGSGCATAPSGVNWESFAVF